MADCVPYAIHVVTGIEMNRVLIMASEVGHDAQKGMSPVAGWSLLQRLGCVVTPMKPPEGPRALSQVLGSLDGNKTYILSTKDHWLAVVKGKKHDKAMTHGKTNISHVFEVVSAPEFKIEPPPKPVPLTVSQLAKNLSEASRQGMGHRKVRLKIDRGTVAIGGGHSVDVVGVSAGFDWNSGTVFLEPSEELSVADDKLAKLRDTLHRSSDLIYRLTSIIEDSRHTPEKKVELMAGWLVKHAKKDSD